MLRGLHVMVQGQKFLIPYQCNDYYTNYISETFAERLQSNNIYIEEGVYYMTLDLGYMDEDNSFAEMETSFEIRQDSECTFDMYIFGGDAEEIEMNSNNVIIIDQTEQHWTS